MTLHQLPGEVWVHVLGYLSVADKHSVRVTCTYLKELVDCGLLWEDWTIVLAFPKGSYSRQFWETLRRRKISNVMMRSTKEKDWKQLALGLPSLTSLVIEQSTPEVLGNLKNFALLTHLAVRCIYDSLFLNASAVCEAEKLTHLSICRVLFPANSIQHLICAIRDFANLTSLVCHDIGIREHCSIMISSILCYLPRLKHLSLTCAERYLIPPSLPVPSLPHALSSLELIHCDPSLLWITKVLPNLQTLVLVYTRSPGYYDSPANHGVSENLSACLSGLPRLSTFVIKRGPRVHTYVHSIPASLSRLTLRVPNLTSTELTSLASQVPNLLHLHIDTWPKQLGTLAAQIPQLFPKLQSLKVRGQHVSEKDFLGFQKMVELRYVEVLDNWPQFSMMASKVQMLTNSRVQVIMSRQRDILDCHCSP